MPKGANKIDMSGQKIGLWTVLKEGGRSKYQKVYWVCQCECGIIKEVDGVSLRNNDSSGCRKCKSRRLDTESPVTNIFYSAKARSKKRNFPFNITKKDILNILIQQNFKCALSGVDINIFSQKHLRSKTTASLDRIDSSKGYEIDNIQWVHKEINHMKSDSTDANFINWCKLVAANN